VIAARKQTAVCGDWSASIVVERVFGQLDESSSFLKHSIILLCGQYVSWLFTNILHFLENMMLR